MYCENCGAYNSDHAKFCVSCGYTLQNAEPGKAVPSQPAFQPAPQAVPPVQSAPRHSAKKKLPPGAWIGIGAGALVLIAAAILIPLLLLGGKPKINLNDYVRIEFQGYEGYGYATLNVDFDQLENDYGKKLSFTGRGKKLYGASVKPVDVIQKSTFVKINEYQPNLSNGDVISYSWDMDSDGIEKVVKCRIEFESASVQVSGLDEVVDFDPFEHLNVTFSGMEPYGEAVIEYDGDYLTTSDFEIDRTEDLSIGDTVTVKLYADDPEYFAEYYGWRPSATEKEYTVDTLSRYITSYSELNEEAITAFTDEVYKIAENYTFADSTTVEEIKNLGYFFVAAGDGSENFLGYVVRFNTRLDPSSKVSKNVFMYTYILFRNVIGEPDGSITCDLSDYTTEEDKEFEVELQDDSYVYTFTYYGYESLDALKTDLKGYVPSGYSFDFQATE